MVSPKQNKDVALIIGPTASGKSALALELAKKQALKGQKSVIINADSAQVYSDLQIISARPSEAEMRGIPHKLYGTIDGSEACSAARWASDAKAAIKEAHDQDILPILVGGTGLYVRTLLDGIAHIPAIDPEIRENIRKSETSYTYKALQNEDPVSAKRLNSNDKNRIQRALEIIRSTGHPIDYWHQNIEGGIANDIILRPIVLLPPREWLYARCDLRFTQMIEKGAIEEVKALLERKLSADCPVMRAIGVPEITALIKGGIDEDTAIERCQIATRRYAKRQYTWFRNQCPVSWPRWDKEINNDNINNIEI